MLLDPSRKGHLTTGQQMITCCHQTFHYEVDTITSTQWWVSSGAAQRTMEVGSGGPRKHKLHKPAAQPPKSPTSFAPNLLPQLISIPFEELMKGQRI